jgi:hypothetical protein
MASNGLPSIFNINKGLNKILPKYIAEGSDDIIAKYTSAQEQKMQKASPDTDASGKKTICMLTLEPTHYQTGTYGGWYGDSIWTNDLLGDKLVRISGQKTARDDHYIIKAIKNKEEIIIFYRLKASTSFKCLGKGIGKILKEKSIKGLTLFDIIIQKKDISDEPIPKVNPPGRGKARYMKDCFTYLNITPPNNPFSCFWNA